MTQSTTTPDDASHTDDTGAVQAQLDSIRGLLERQGSDRDNERRTRIDRTLGIVGSVLVPTGIVAILLGWYGAAHTPHLFEQVPYLISGGLLGVGLVIGGGLLFFGSWVARMEQESTGIDDLVDSVDRLREELVRRPPVGGLAPSTNGTGTHHLVATPTGTMLHRPDCSVVAERDADALVHVAADEDGYRPCKLCDPLEN